MAPPPEPPSDYVLVVLAGDEATRNAALLAERLAERTRPTQRLSEIDVASFAHGGARTVVFFCHGLRSGLGPTRTEVTCTAAELASIHYESVATLNLAFDVAAVGHPLDGFGFVASKREGLSMMACTFVHRKFAGRSPAGKVLLRAFVGGAFGLGWTPCVGCPSCI